MKNLQQWAAVQELHRKKIPIAQIARELGMTRNTVKKLIKQKEEPKYTRTTYPSKMEPYLDKIIDWRTLPEYDFNGTRIYRELQKIGYEGSINPLYRALKRIDEQSRSYIPIATVRIETPVGDQAQFDWSPYDMVIGQEIKRVYCFTMILAACRKKAVCFSLTCDGEAIYEAIQELFDDLGGVTLELLIDNPKALVIDNNYQSEEEIRYNPKALLLAAHLGMELNACNCYWPRTKGKVEKPYQYIEEQFIKGNPFKTMEALNFEGKAFINAWNHETHSTTRRIPNEYFETEEKQALLPLPPKRLRFKPLINRIVSNDSYIHINTNQYSLLVDYVAQTIRYRIVYGFRIEVYTGDDQRILTVEAFDGRHGLFKQEEHYAAIAPRASKSIPQIRRDFTRLFENGQRYLDEASHHFQQPTYHARKILELTDLYKPEDLDQVLGYGLAHGLLDIKAIKRLLRDHFFEIISQNKEMSTKMEVREHESELIRNCDYYEIQQEEITL
ncbi:IS21 family transposase [Acetobacterium tundrae]|uniref:IS21 family transposase n=1 Tax=Acetobacterium tundrae TaxID=132932 RepID=UPI00164BAA11|nr:IS21 family transposase [Acetobacterium tundrae]